jgi:hypothetical protein
MAHAGRQQEMLQSILLLQMRSMPLIAKHLPGEARDRGVRSTFAEHENTERL